MILKIALFYVEMICGILEGINEFEDEIPVQAEEIPAGIIVQPGTYLLCFVGDVKPQIETFNTPFGLTTETMIVYGQGFGNNGDLYLNGEKLEVLSWSYNRIEFVISEDAKSGYLTVETGGLSSDPVELLVKEKKYSVSLYPRKLLINRGEELKVSFAITGFSDAIDFTIKGVAVGMTCQFVNSDLDIVPNYTLECILTTTEEMETDTYQLELIGQVGDKVQSYEFEVIVAELPEIKNQEFAEGRVGVQYRDWIDVDGGFVPYQIEVLDNSMPLGLRMDENGVVSGVPVEPGVYFVKVQVMDTVGTVDQKELRLNVLSNEWIYPEYDVIGRNGTVDNDPASDQIGFMVDVENDSDLLLSSEKMLIAIKDDQADLYSKETSEYLKELTLTGSVIRQRKWQPV